MTSRTIALDAMGGDHGIPVVIPAALEALRRQPDMKLILVGDEQAIHEALPDPVPSNISVLHAPEVVGMDELPSIAMRTKKKSSMRLSINLVKEGKAQAVVSAGNTGALMATARYVLKTLPGVDRPAIMSELPSTKRNIRMLDLGANVDSSSEQMFQFAVMASTLANTVENIPSPRVALLNIGSEEIKGNEQVKATSAKLAQSPDINFIGYIEGDDVYQGLADVVVCDGFVGNVALKTTEGVVKLFSHYVKKAFRSSVYGRFVALLAIPIIKKIAKTLDPDRYNGAILLGLRGIVVKSHGSANAKSFRYAIEEAAREIKHDVPSKIRDKLADILTNGLEE